MIYLYSGTPGSYKSYNATKEILRWLRRGYNVISNYPVDFKKNIHKPLKGVFEFKNTSEITIDYLIEFAVNHHKPSVKAQTLVVFDEASTKFNSREFRAHDRLDWINFLANHRHFNFDIILIAQADIMIDKQIRMLIETEYRHRALKNYKIFGRILDKIFHGLYVVIDMWYPMKLKNRTQFCLFNKRIARCYNTMDLFIESYAKYYKKKSPISNLKGGSTIVECNDEATKKQINNDFVKLCFVLSSYVERNS